MIPSALWEVSDITMNVYFLSSVLFLQWDVNVALDYGQMLLYCQGWCEKKSELEFLFELVDAIYFWIN